MRNGRYRNLLAAALLVVSGVGVALATPTAGEKCEAGKNGAAGKYSACLFKAQQKFVNGGEVDTTRRDEAVLTCGTKYSDKWQSLESKAGTDVCPSQGDELSIQDFLDACIYSAENALTGGVLVPDVVTCNADLGACTADLSTTNADLGSCTGSLGTCNSNYATCSGSLGTCNSDLSTTNADLTACTGDLATTNADLTSCTGDLATANAGTAAVGEVLSGKTFTSSAGLGATGMMPNNGAVTLTPTTSDQAIAAGYHNGSGKCAGDADLTGNNIKIGVNLFGVVGNLEGGCSLSTVSYTDNGDGTVTDNVTGLMWEKLSDDSSIHDWNNLAYIWADASAVKVATLNTMNAGVGFANHTDWRVPNIKELQTLVNFGTSAPATHSAFNSACVPGCTVTTCSCTRSSIYWSSSTYQPAPSYAWRTDFNDGLTDSYDTTGGGYVRAVRGGS